MASRTLFTALPLELEFLPGLQSDLLLAEERDAVLIMASRTPSTSFPCEPEFGLQPISFRGEALAGRFHTIGPFNPKCRGGRGFHGRSFWGLLCGRAPPSAGSST